MKTLILTCNIGEGHNSVAKAIKEAFDAQGDECEIFDSLSLLSTQFSSLVTRVHNSLYRSTPKFNRRANESVEKSSNGFDGNFLVHRGIRHGAKELSNKIREEHFDNVICTHIFPATMISKHIKKFPSSLKTSFVSTDYSCTIGVGDSKLDVCFIPQADMTGEFINHGVKEETIVPSGIPVQKIFCEGCDKEQAKEKLGLPAYKHNILLTCGSMGCGPIAEIEKLLAKTLPPDAMLTVICGTNKKLQKLLSKKKRDNVCVLGYTDQMPLLMDSADLLLTKPGGITLSEAAVKGLPMLLIDTVGGCETGNLNYFTKTGLARTADTPREIAALCIEMIQDPEKLQQSSEALKKAGPSSAASRIYQALC